ncbi:MAG: cupredoxin family copper-binding protein [Bdellovibrionia bacterium]
MSRDLVLSTALSLTLSLACVGQAWAKTHHVVLENMKIAPETVEVKVGDTIVWENHDLVPHTATAIPSTQGSKPAFDSGSIAPNASFKFKAKHAGKYPYQCLFHPTMKANLIVGK